MAPLMARMPLHSFMMNSLSALHITLESCRRRRQIATIVSPVGIPNFKQNTTHLWTRLNVGLS